MNLRLLDLNLLVALDALPTEKYVTQAGVRINLSQSAMSGALARLGSRFGVGLLIQVGHWQAGLALLGESTAKSLESIRAQKQAPPVRSLLQR